MTLLAGLAFVTTLSNTFKWGGWWVIVVAVGFAVLGLAASRSSHARAAVVAVEAGRRGGFALVIDVDRGALADSLRGAGAHLVVSDLDEVGPSEQLAAGV